MSRVWNFSAGPAVLPVEVLQEAADEMLDYKGTGMSVMEMSHRSKAFETIINEAEADLRTLTFPSGWCKHTVCYGSNELYEKSQSRLCDYRTMGNKSMERSRYFW